MSDSLPVAETGRHSEIEVTPEMIEAGVDALTLWDCDENPSLVVRSVFEAMLSVPRT